MTKQLCLNRTGKVAYLDIILKKMKLVPKI